MEEWATKEASEEAAKQVDESSNHRPAAAESEGVGGGEGAAAAAGGAGDDNESEQSRVQAERDAAMVRRYQASTNQEEIDFSLLQKLLTVICGLGSSEGASSAPHHSHGHLLPVGAQKRAGEGNGKGRESATEQWEEGRTPIDSKFASLLGNEGSGQGEGTSRADEAILVFLAGWEEISRLRERLLASPIFGDPARFLILPLHSMLHSMEQRKVFGRPPDGVRKIVLATNIAETALTIDDIVFVIDCGRLREKSYDPYTNVATLQVRRRV